MIRHLRIMGFLSPLLLLMLGIAPSHTCAEELVKNPGFEELENGFPAHWRGARSVYEASEEARGGKRSLHYSNEDPDIYQLCLQKVDLKPGRTYEVSAWIKTRNIRGEGGGATLCLEWQKDGEWMGGSYPEGLRGTHDWTRWQHRMQTIPESADSAHIVCYVRKGMTGEAWFDDIEVTRVKKPALRAVLLEPCYRGWIYENWPDAFNIQVEVNAIDYDFRVSQVHVDADISPAEGGKSLSKKTYRLQKPECQLILQRPELAPGRYTLKLTLERRDSGEDLAATEFKLRRWPGNRPDARCWIDRHHRLIVDGEPFFPLGMYASLPKAADLKRISSAGFNCLMPYGLPHGSLERISRYLDLAREHGVKTIFSTKDIYEGTRWFPKGGVGPWKTEQDILHGLVKEFRDHPNVIAWYLNDERPLSMLDRLRAHQRITHRLDHDHPTWVVLYQVRDVRGYLGTFDAIGTDPYPIAKDASDIGRAGRWTHITREQVYGARPIWMVPQAHNWEEYKDNKECRSPTYEELRNMAFQCLCEGANGLVFYAYHCLKRDPDTPFEQRWEDMSPLASELDELKPVLLSVEEPPDVSVKGEKAMSFVKHYQGNTYVFLVNPKPSGNSKVKVALPENTAEVTLDGDPVSATSPSLSVSLQPLAVRTLRFSGN